MPDREIEWPVRAYIEREAAKASEETEKRIRALLGVSSDAALEELREDVRYARRQRKASEARANEVNNGMARGFINALWGVAIAVATALTTWFVNNGVHK